MLDTLAKLILASAKSYPQGMTVADVLPDVIARFPLATNRMILETLDSLERGGYVQREIKWALPGIVRTIWFSLPRRAAVHEVDDS